MHGIEIWVDIPGCAQNYQACADGRIRSWVHRHGRRKEPKILKPTDAGKGYLVVGLYVDGKRYHRYVHQVIAETFLGDNPGNLQVDHINGKRGDNRAANLEYVSARENVNRACLRYKKASRHRGVHRNRNQWIASICNHGNTYIIGRYNCEADAARAYAKAFELVHLGEIEFHKQLISIRKGEL